MTTLPWEGVPLAPRHWPGQARVFTLAATLRLMFGKEFEIALHPPGWQERKGKLVIVKYMDLPPDRQVQFYPKFRNYYNHMIQRTLT